MGEGRKLTLEGALEAGKRGCCGPEGRMEYRVDPVAVDKCVGQMVVSIRAGVGAPTSVRQLR